jgi:hypothetical protein
MHMEDANQLLDAFYLPFESGWKRLDSGVINIAVRTHMTDADLHHSSAWGTITRNKSIR